MDSLAAETKKNLKAYPIAYGIGLFLVLLFAPLAQAAGSAELFSQAQREASSGASDFAYLHYAGFLRANPQTAQRPYILFAQGEYNFWSSDYRMASSFFNQMLNERTSFEGKLFALVYLYKIAEIKNQADVMHGLESQIRGLKKHAFVFRQSKEYRFQSLLQRNLKAVYSIDKVEFYVDKRPFTKITY